MKNILIILLRTFLQIEKVYLKLSAPYVKRLKWYTDYIRSLYFCLKYLPYEQAVKVPIKIEKGVKTIQLKKGQIKIECFVKKYQIVIGVFIEETYKSAYKETVLLCKDEGQLIFKGAARIYRGTIIRVDNDAKIIFGTDFIAQTNTLIRSTNLISFGIENVVAHSIIITTNGHPVLKNGVECEMEAPIIFGDRVWICTNCIIGKGTELADDCIVAQGSVVMNKKVTKPKTLLHGFLAVESEGEYERNDCKSH